MLPALSGGTLSIDQSCEGEPGYIDAVCLQISLEEWYGPPRTSSSPLCHTVEQEGKIAAGTVQASVRDRESCRGLSGTLASCSPDHPLSSDGFLTVAGNFSAGKINLE